MLKRRKLLIIAAVILFTLVLTGCLPGDGKNSPDNPAGFLWGIWHGWIAPVSLIVSLFKENISLFESHNSGFWYELGFYLAIVGGFGSLRLFRKKHKQDWD